MSRISIPLIIALFILNIESKSQTFNWIHDLVDQMEQKSIIDQKVKIKRVYEGKEKILKFESHYNDEGLLTEYIQYKKLNNNSKVVKMKYLYNSLKNVAKIVIDEEGKEFIDSCIYEYDNNGNIMNKICRHIGLRLTSISDSLPYYDKTLQFINVELFEYDSTGKKVKYSWNGSFDTNETDFDHYYYSYNDQGKLEQIHLSRYDSTVHYLTKVKYTKNDDIKSIETKIRRELNSAYEFHYNEGNLTKITSKYDSKDSIWEFLPSGLLHKKISRKMSFNSKMGSKNEREILTYEYIF